MEKNGGWKYDTMSRLRQVRSSPTLALGTLHQVTTQTAIRWHPIETKKKEILVNC